MTYMVYNITHVENNGVHRIDGNLNDLFNIINIDVSKETIDFTLIINNMEGLVIINAPERNMIIHLTRFDLSNKSYYISNSNTAKIVVAKRITLTSDYNRFIRVNGYIIDLETKNVLTNHKGKYQVNDLKDVIRDLKGISELIQYLL